ncbi:MAG TPA: DUF2946 family protein [Gemmatimonadales bacterium]
MRMFRRVRFRQLLTVVAALSFGATGPGLSGVELAAHISGLVDLSHQRRAHLEPAGQSGHTDHCQLGLVAYDGRLPAAAVPMLRHRAELAERPTPTCQAAPRLRRWAFGFPRAPPV